MSYDVIYFAPCINSAFPRLHRLHRRSGREKRYSFFRLSSSKISFSMLITRDLAKWCMRKCSLEIEWRLFARLWCLLGEGIQGEVLLNVALYREGPPVMAVIFFPSQLDDARRKYQGIEPKNFLPRKIFIFFKHNFSGDLG